MIGVVDDCCRADICLVGEVVWVGAGVGSGLGVSFGQDVQMNKSPLAPCQRLPGIFRLDLGN